MPLMYNSNLLDLSFVVTKEDVLEDMFDLHVTTDCANERLTSVAHKKYIVSAACASKTV